ncbi:uncharacterized protein LOC143301088 [Babylonia areolata]|uniref:uncharacterized protein LOC143301088 n=1 Tax=Babylonia areolata TaxID=304850 RepID=UPI003FD4C0EE
MALTRPLRPSTTTTTTILALTSLVLFNVAMTSAMPWPLPRRDLKVTARDNNNNNDDDDGKATSTPGAITATGMVVGSAAEDCPRGHYFSGMAAACKPCSSCPVNQIIRRPCTARADTVCGPFFEFDKFHQSPAAVKMPGEEEEEEEGGENDSGEQAREHGPAVTSGSEGPGDLNQRTISLQIAGGQWRTLSFALIAVLSFICCLIVVVGLYVWIILRRSQAQRLVLREPELLTPHPYPEMDPEPRYVETFVTSRDRLRTSRHLPVYQQIFTGCDASELPSLTSSARDVKTGKLAIGEGEEEGLCVYVNTAALDHGDS